MAGTEYFGQTAVQPRDHTCQHHAEITQSHTFAALIRLSTTTHNLLTFNISEISSNNSENLSLLPHKHFCTFLLHLSYSRSRMYSHTVGGPLARVKVHLQFCSHLIHLTPKAAYSRGQRVSGHLRKANNVVPFCLSPNQGD